VSLFAASLMLPRREGLRDRSEDNDRLGDASRSCCGVLLRLTTGSVVDESRFDITAESKPNADGGRLEKNTESSSYSGKSSTSSVEVTTALAVINEG
jgi:hypothetical protein